MQTIERKRRLEKERMKREEESERKKRRIVKAIWIDRERNED